MRRIHLTILAIVAISATAFAGKVERATETITLEGAKHIEIQGDLGAGNFTISVEEMPEAAQFDIEYDKRAVKYYVDYYEKGEKGFLTFESDRRNNVGFDTEENRWDIVLSNKYESSMDLNIGACDANFDLGGLPLRDLSIEIGAASGVIDFSKPNPIRLEEFKMNAGATSLEMHQIGNANFSRFDFSGGVGSFDLDFRGDYKGESEIVIEIGLGSADITLPYDVPVKVTTSGDNWLSSVTFHDKKGVSIEDDEFVTDGFDEAKDRIVINIEVGLGSVDLYWKD